MSSVSFYPLDVVSSGLASSILFRLHPSILLCSPPPTRFPASHSPVPPRAPEPLQVFGLVRMSSFQSIISQQIFFVVLMQCFFRCNVELHLSLRLPRAAWAAFFKHIMIHHQLLGRFSSSRLRDRDMILRVSHLICVQSWSYNLITIYGMFASSRCFHTFGDS